MTYHTLYLNITYSHTH